MIYSWGHQRRFNAYSNYFKKLFGNRIQKVTIDAGFTCPNRDGKVGQGGCTYCNNDAFNPSYCNPTKSVTQQIREGIEFHHKRYKGTEQFLAYFQAYSNTYADLSYLKKIYDEALKYPGIIGLVIGTRPDCIDKVKLDYFEQLSKKVYLIIEYGIESCYDETLERINRGHSFDIAKQAIEQTAERGIRTGAHVIFGLPGESRQQMLDEAAILSALPLTNIKFHQLQIVKGTQIALEYSENPDDFQLFGMEEYLEFFADFIEMLNPNFVVERFIGEVPPPLNAGPSWGRLRNDQLINRFEKLLESRDSWQGKYFKAN